MKKTLALILAVFMVMTGFLAGCSGSGGSGGTSDNGGASADFTYTGSGPITDQEGATVSMLAQNSYYTTVDIKEAPIVKKVQEDAGVTVEWTLVDPTNYQDAVSPMLAAGTDLPDIVLLPDRDANMTYISAGLFVKLDEYFDYMPNFKKWLDANPIMKASLTADDGHIYYVPGTNVTHNYQPSIMYNMKWLSDAGKEVPETLDQFVELMRYYQETDMNGDGNASDEIPMSITYTKDSDFLSYMFGPAFGLDLTSDTAKGFFINDDDAVEYGYTSDNYKAYLTFLNGLYAEGLLELEFTTLTRDQVIERFAQDKTGVTFDFGWQQSMTYSPQLSYYDGTPETGVVAQRPLSGEHEGFYAARVGLGNIFGVNAKSDNILNAVKFLDYTISEENQEMYVWGIEGESYTVESDGSRVYTEQAGDNEWLQQLGINPAQVYPAYQSVAATNALVAPWHGDADAALEKYMREPWPFIYATEDEASIISQYAVDIQTYVDEMKVSFITGTTSIDQFDSYVASLESMNIDEIIKIRQAQYDRFKKALE
ncbi:MAG: extracellular solute-binding protein [Oscillospiraceae bacterium]